MFTPPLPIDTGRLQLRAFVPDDFDALFSYRSRPDVARFLLHKHETAEQVRERLERSRKRTSWEQEGDGLVLAVVHGELLVGEVHLHWTSEQNRTAEIGFLFHPDHQGLGYAREASTAMLRLAFDTLDVHRVIGQCDARNTASSGLMRRLGMREEALFRQSDLVDGEWRDGQVFAILRQEWREQLGS